MDSERNLNRICTIFEEKKNNPEFEQVKVAIDQLQQVMLEGGDDDLYVSFNGGKDATVVLFLTYFARKGLGYTGRMKCLYFQEADPFEEIKEFMAAITGMLQLKIYSLKSKNYQGELLAFSQEHSFKKIVMGSRRDDPGCGKLGFIAQSDIHKGYPDFKRINPIIDWSYSFLWKFIKEFDIPYCSLYNEGYTSLGEKKNTIKNQALYDEKVRGYKQAWEASEEVERDCRKDK